MKERGHRSKFGRRESGAGGRARRKGPQRSAAPAQPQPQPQRAGGAPQGKKRPKRRGRTAAPQAEARRKHAVSHAGQLVEGHVSAHRAGYGFLRVEGLKESIFLPPPQMRGVMHGDRVRVRLKRDTAGRWLGTLERVLEHGVSTFLGTVQIAGRSAWVTAADRRVHLRCAVAREALRGARDGEWVIARITRRGSGEETPHARIERRLDPDRPAELAVESALARFGLPHDFPAEALREAQAWGDQVDPNEASRREDLRHLPLVTIDGADARDFDDAVYAERHPDGFRLIVAIADVSHYVRPDTALDQEARKRGTSVYFPTRVVPMLPMALSDHLCSLAPQVDRLCLVADLLISARGALKRSRFYPAVMRSAARLTYTQAQEALFEGRPAARDALGALLQPLQMLVEVYRALHKARARRGALDFDAPEARLVIDESERVRAVDLRLRNDAHRLIEECMVVANVAVAQALSESRTPTLYRVHGEPEAEKLERLVATLAALQIDAHLPERIATRDLQAIARRLGSAPERPFIESLIVRSMPQAVYQPVNVGHFGLALTHYAHFTSPIRRYPDLIVHRTLKARLGETGNAAMRYETGPLAELGESTSRLEKRADEADRYVATFLKCTYLRERIGQVFRGLITTVVEFGCFVQILDVAVDGLLRLESLRDDEYVLEGHGHAWRGRRSGRRLATGAHLRVIVSAVNPIEGLVDLELAEED